ncbi:MAG: acyl-CoA dehydrogenase family protein [Clostridia bacterium]|nr:acyl-CoA dehydrogenase family protein [Deltaproteobacteria bacterium]
MSITNQYVGTGGAFAHVPVLTGETFTPERFSDEQRAYRQTALDFSEKEVEPKVFAIDHKEPGVMPGLMKKAAEIGLFMVEIPEAYGGLGLDKVTGMLVAEAMARVGSFAVTYGAHTNIGTMPIVFYGTHPQKEKYLPKLASGEWIAAYCLSEPDSGSDALAAKTVAKLTPDGKHYVLNGTKQWITNGAFADVFTIFAQVDGDKFTAFIVEKKCKGLVVGNEEHKLGIRGSSTTQIILEDVHVPVENVLGDVGRGHKIAFNILNIGRWKLGSGSIGGAKHALGIGVRYAKERKQFKKPIASFGLIRQKIAEAATAIYSGEAMAYRLGGNIDQRIAALDSAAADYPQKSIDVIDEFTMEASICKVFGSEALYKIADDMLQIHGGNGYVEDYPVERILRDARINRIFEGTNEINRLIIPATLFKRALQGQMPLMEYTATIIEELGAPETLPKKQPGQVGPDAWATELAKRAVIYAASYAAQKYMQDLREKQLLLGALADCLIDIYGMDSVVARANQALKDLPESQHGIHNALASLFCFEARANVFQRLRRVAMMMAEGDELEMLYANLEKLDQRYRVDFMRLQDEVAKKMIDDDGYTV